MTSMVGVRKGSRSNYYLSRPATSGRRISYQAPPQSATWQVGYGNGYPHGSNIRIKDITVLRERPMYGSELYTCIVLVGI